MVEHLTGYSPVPIGPDPGDIIAGIGLRDRCQSEDLLHLVDACLQELGCRRTDLVGLVTLDRKASHPAVLMAASVLGVPVIPLHTAALGAHVPNPSTTVARYTGSPSIAEAAALHFGPLLVPKTVGPNATCALSRLVAGPYPPMSSASIAAATVSTSKAGP